MGLRTDTNNPDVLALLPLPDLGDVSDAQFRGVACVWGGEPVNTDTAVDLGQRRIKCSDGHLTASPRACLQCTARKVYRVLYFRHAPTCELCVENAADCEIGSALVRLLRDGIRAGFRA